MTCNYPEPTSNPDVDPDIDPTPIPEDDNDTCDENAPALLPEDINNLLQILGQYLLPDVLNPVIEKVNNFTSNVNSANNLAGKYGFSTQATKEEKARVKYDGFVEKINQSKQELLTESANLKTIASNILNEVKTKSNINKQLLSKESDFNSYKLKVEELVDEFNYLVTDENTFSLAEASGVYGQEVGLLAEIIEDYANRVLPVKVSNEEELEQYQDDETGFEKIQTTKGLIKYLKSRIEGQKTRLDKANGKLSEELDENIKKQLVNLSVQAGYFSETTFQLLFENNMINPETLQLDLSKIEEGNNNFSTQSLNSNKKSFSIKEHTAGDSLAEAFIESKKQIGGYINQGEGYVNTAINYWFNPSTVEMLSILSDVSATAYEKTHPEVKLTEKARNSMNSAMRTSIDYYANALANAVNSTDWGHLPSNEQQKRINNYKEVFGDILNLDTLASSVGTFGASKISQLAKISKSLDEALDIVKSKKAKDIEKIDELLKNVKDPVIKQKLKDMKKDLNQDIKQIDKVHDELQTLEEKKNGVCSKPACKKYNDNYNPNTGLYEVKDSVIKQDQNRKILVNGQYIKNPSSTNLDSFTIDSNGKLHWPNGGYEGGKVVTSNILMYAVDKNGNVIIGAQNSFTDPITGKNNYYSHPNLIGGENPQVLSAGEIRVKDGKIISIDNISGHYVPSASSLEVSKQGFSSLPDNVFRDNNRNVFNPR